ncbi:hypothetical protein [Maribacter sp.]|uniref:TapB family protein n=1 Tax=Maribacter sp. TaxID=1897614 RepID=UPI0025C130ED|nr:hypothetical protein [Maribacter sp.]
MKKTLGLLVTIWFLSYSVFAQDGCSMYYPMEKGTSFEYTNYNKKGKVEGVTSYSVVSVISEGSATKATLYLKLLDKKGEESFNTSYSYTCEDNMVRIDYKSLFPAAMMKQYESMGLEMEISGNDIEVPNNLSVGKELKDANVTVNMNMSGMNMSISVDMTNRKVIAKENITTETGTYECYVLSENTTSKTMGANIEMSSKLWLSKGVGMIKQETYKKNGDLMSRTELTKFHK